ncbi:hypothetical protein QWY99_22135 [Flavobacterium branchiarum]|uniref:Lipoprotein n=1 Tax=Flavobacterium branchiarum TaxID=1114870 RepID=A0ABV5FSJ5_9FLAO|nr:hypothetical protein [Flavobacterium branchiarum]MDN3671504.1 hypothetical protein [Flavobacterium branchiarum]MDN3672619.1 hypothetical protein [Flavobacterium branchiarum]MDN3675737.1 hypothetical protein [Flavobacterium branchiarum]
MKNLKLKFCLSIFCFVVLATTLVACKSSSVVPPTTIETTTTVTTKEVVRDTTFKIPQDNSYYKAYLECVNGKVVMNKDVKPVSTPGKHLEPPKVNLQDNILTVDCKAEAIKLFAQWKDVYTKEHQQIIKKIPYPVERELSWWQLTQIYCGRLFLTLLALFIIVVVLQKTNVIKY